MKSKPGFLDSAVRVFATSLALWGLACGAKAPSAYESNTNWLRSCTKDAQCAAGMICACGACSEACSGGGDGSCPGDLACQAESVCGAGERTACVARCETDAECSYLSKDATCNDGACRADVGVSQVAVGQNRSSTPVTSSEASSNASGMASSAAPCSVAGHYERGKGSTVPNCCAGLTQVFFDSPAEVDGVRQCIQPAGHVNFACVEGSCGDGECEVGENIACGCAADCPAARIEVGAGSASGGVPSNSSAPSSTSVAAECHSADGVFFSKSDGVSACCPGLNEVGHDVETYSNGKTVCVPVPSNTFVACLTGICGDGLCEPAEDFACGCALDCKSAALSQGLEAPVATSCNYLGGDYPIGSKLPNMCAPCTCEAGGVIQCGDVICSQSGSIMPCSQIPNYDPNVNHHAGLDVSVAQVVGQQVIVQYQNLCEAGPYDMALCYRDVKWGSESSLVWDFIFTDRAATPCASPKAGETRFYLGGLAIALTSERGTQSAATALKTNYGVYQLPAAEPGTSASCGPCTVTSVASNWCKGEELATQPVEWVCGSGDSIPQLDTACTILPTNAARWCCAPTFSLSCEP